MSSSASAGARSEERPEKKSPALAKLLSRTLAAQRTAKKDTRSRRRAKKRRAEEAAAESVRRDPELAQRAKQMARERMLAVLAERVNDADRKLSLLAQPKRAPAVAKKMKQPGPGGLTPGLAPVGYEPDESSDDEPY